MLKFKMARLKCPRVQARGSSWQNEAYRPFLLSSVLVSSLCSQPLKGSESCLEAGDGTSLAQSMLTVASPPRLVPLGTPSWAFSQGLSGGLHPGDLGAGTSRISNPD